MKTKILALLLIINQLNTVLAQQTTENDFDVLINKTISLSEKALYEARFEEALQYVDYDYFKKFKLYEDKHKIALTIQNIRVQSFKARLHESSFNTDEYFNSLRNLLPVAEGLDDAILKAKFYTLLSSFYRSKNPELCTFYESKALAIFNKHDDNKSVAELKATQISWELDHYMRSDNSEEVIALIPKFRAEINYSAKHSKYALAYNTRHLANIYRIYVKNQEEALKLYQQSLTLREEIGFRPFIPASHFSTGLVYFNLGRHELAIEAFSKSIEEAEKIHFVRYQCNPHLNIGDVFLAKENKIKAKEHYSKALKSAALNNYEKGINAALEKISSL